MAQQCVQDVLSKLLRGNFGAPAQTAAIGRKHMVSPKVVTNAQERSLMQLSATFAKVAYFTGSGGPCVGRVPRQHASRPHPPPLGIKDGDQGTTHTFVYARPPFNRPPWVSFGGCGRWWPSEVELALEIASLCWVHTTRGSGAWRPERQANEFFRPTYSQDGRAK